MVKTTLLHPQNSTAHLAHIASSKNAVNEAIIRTSGEEIYLTVKWFCLLDCVVNQTQKQYLVNKQEAVNRSCATLLRV